MALKTSTRVVAGSGILFTVGAELEDIAEKAGRKAVFIPTIKDKLEKWGVSDHVDGFLDRVGYVKDPNENKQIAVEMAAKAFKIPAEEVEVALNRKSLEQIRVEEAKEMSDIKEID